MRIIQITPAYKPAYIYGGPTMSVAKLCEAITAYIRQNDLNHNLDQSTLEVLTTTANGKQELVVEDGKQIMVDGVPVTYFKRLTKDHTHFSPALLKHLRKLIITHKKKEDDSGQLIIHIHSWWNLVVIFSCIIAKMYQIPVVLSPRGMLTDYTQHNKNSFIKSTLHFLLGKSLLKYCHILASSEQEKNDVELIVKPKSISILPNLINLQANTIAVSRDYAVLKLIFLSRIEEKKGLDLLFKSLAHVDIPWRLTIAGSGEATYVESLKLIASQLKIGEKITWIGQVKNDDKFNLLAAHDLMVLTSHNENFANVVVESLSVGTPVLLTKYVGLSSYVASNDLGFVADFDEHSIAEKLKIAYHEPTKRDYVRDNAPNIIKKDFDEQHLVKEYLQVYNNCLK